MTERQKKELSLYCRLWQNSGKTIEWHHGCCIGADVEFDNIVRNYERYGHLHPSNNTKTFVDCFENGDILYPEKPPLVRDRDIVNAVEILIAAPYQEKEIIHSGTWTTVRYAKQKGIEIIILKR